MTGHEAEDQLVEADFRHGLLVNLEQLFDCRGLVGGLYKLFNKHFLTGCEYAKQTVFAIAIDA
jgi:hypothetical protein